MSDEIPAPTRGETRDSERLRPHPTDRFAGPQHAFNLDDVTVKLRQELEAGQHGHRQATLYKRGSTTVALFLFGHLTGLPAHRTRGTVTIHVLEGHLQIVAQGQTHDLFAGHLLVLAAGVEHDVTARTVSRMLLTVHLDAAGEKSPT